MDIIKELAELAFASRLKRLSERLAKDVSRLYHRLDLDFEARWFAILYSLNQHSPQAITELAQSLGLTHTAINQLTNEMMKKHLLSSSKEKRDERKRLIYLTPEGEAIINKLAPVWEEIRKATKELIEATGSDWLALMTMIEDELDKQDMYERVWFRLKGNLPGDIEIREYTPALKKYFKSLNYEWLEEYFEVENADQKYLLNPNDKIIKMGGAIFFACLDDTVVGTCALIKHKDDTLELAKMAVTKKYQNRGIGQKLLQAVIERATQSGATALYLQTNEKLEVANYLYQKFGFQYTPDVPFRMSNYQRPTFVMKLDLKSPDLTQKSIQTSPIK
ncbi:MarR family transcriptional regulator/GNAT family N-acetyltransferase [candidate division KSB1 bacterium]|nr:MarR family transcriptional regulator/GNAT family N-acetyltransferase [candidate division KSB1 bacterium]